MPLFRLAALPTMRVLLASNLRRPGMGSGTPVVTGKSMVTRTLARTAKQESSASHGHEENSQPSPMAQATKQANVATAPVKEKSHGRVHELTFEPFEEIREPLNDVQKSLETNSSTARAPWFTAEAEDAINAQINVELTISHVYDSMWAYFDRDNVALRGLAAYFAHESAEERRHAQSLMSYLNRRGGRVHLSTIPEPVREFSHPDKGDALNAMELSLALERLNMQKLQQLDKLAHDLDDFNLSDFVDDMLDDQSKDVKRAAEYVAQLQRVGKGHGVWHWDETLYAGLK